LDGKFVFHLIASGMGMGSSREDGDDKIAPRWYEMLKWKF